MLLSFIVPVYNNVDAFAECVGSLRPLLDDGTAEVVAVDDGSAMPPVADVAGVRILRFPHRGAAAARNAGIEAAQGDFVWPVDADDVIETDGIRRLMDDLRTMPTECNLFHIGGMLTQKQRGERPPVAVPEPRATYSIDAILLVRARGSVADHTTNVIRRSWLMEHPTLRYPEGMSLLEDTVFSLRVAEAAGLCQVNDTYRFYCHRTYHPSATAGAWSAERSGRFVGDICSFFNFLGEYAERHRNDSGARQFYERMRYVYLRVVAVKGCPSSDIVRLTDVVGTPRRCPMPVYRFIAFLCRTFRKKR